MYVSIVTPEHGTEMFADVKSYRFEVGYTYFHMDKGLEFWDGNRSPARKLGDESYQRISIRKTEKNPSKENPGFCQRLIIDFGDRRLTYMVNTKVYILNNEGKTIGKH